jgi:hypothetical protein
MKLKKGSAAAKAFMAKIRAKKGKVGAKKVATKTPVKKVSAKYVNIFGQRVKVGTKKYDIMMHHKKQFDDFLKHEISGW